jgi:hypothetical protein
MLSSAGRVASRVRTFARHRTNARAEPPQPLLLVESSAMLRHTLAARQSTPPMQIRIVKNPPAPRMDGWDVSAFCVGQECEVESRIGNYLIVAGYAVRVERDGKPERHDSGASRT